MTYEFFLQLFLTVFLISDHIFAYPLLVPLLVYLSKELRGILELFCGCRQRHS